MPTVALDKTRSYVLSTMNSLPYPMSMGEIKEAVARVSRLSRSMGGNYCPSLVETAISDLVTEGKLVVIDHQYVSRRHIPRFRTLDADWQW